jgi:phosphoribosylanthranilate isomerase
VGALGFTLGLPHGVHDDLTEDKARSIIENLPTGLLPVLITYLATAEQACRLAKFVGAVAVQFHGGISNEELLAFREACPGTRTIGRVTVKNESAVQIASGFQSPLWDAIILDSFDPETCRVGATGISHDWSISAQIVRNSPLPVILAGGLNPDNVADAIKKVRPCAVDAHTGLEEANGARSFAKIEAFTCAALNAFQLISPLTDLPSPS